MVEKTQAEIMKEQNDSLELEIARKKKLENDALVSGTAGIRPEIKPAPVETAKEYADRIMHNKIPVKKDGN
jgi:hypothetical protein